MHIYEKSVSFVRPDPKFGARLAIIWGKRTFLIPLLAGDAEPCLPRYNPGGQT
ncbi:MAG: hypothetical protein JRI26_11390 [Deltaproteobacteria bacterium]|nr:hypothetical protein [Deltaproteobacteria bacterium]